jgi:hypothetical protein
MKVKIRYAVAAVVLFSSLVMPVGVTTQDNASIDQPSGIGPFRHRPGDRYRASRIE